MSPISPARTAAFDILLRVDQGAYAVELLHSARLDQLSVADRGLCTEIVMGVERWRSTLDGAIAAQLAKPLTKLDREVLLALRIAVYQLIFLQRVPTHAAINDSVELVKRARKRSAAGLANAVLRKIAAAPAVKAAPQSNDAAGMAREFAHPEWLVLRWVESYGLEAARALCSFNQQLPATAVRMRRNSAEVEQELASEGVQLVAGALMASARRLLAGDITKTRAFAEQRIAIQDEASQLVAVLVGHGARILDCCAAPGGKTAAIADANPSAEVVAVELHEHRTRLLRKLVTNSNVTCMTADIRNLPISELFDRVLVDAPCSGTGTLARNPEIKWRISPRDVADLQQRQIEILTAAAAHLASTGRLVYATCSLEPEEGERLVEQVLKQRTELHTVSMRSELQRLLAAGELTCGDLGSLTRGDFLRTVPGVHQCDGFFAAILQRN